MLHYILQVICFQLSFLLVYEILLKKETFFTYNRWYLLLVPIISLLLPLLKIDRLLMIIPEEFITAISGLWLPEIYIGGEAGTAQELPAVKITDKQYFQINWWLFIYVTGLFGSLLLFFKKYRNLRGLFGFREISREKVYRIIEIPQSKMACTFYKTIFLGDQLSENEKRQILSHELIHVKQKHSLDLLFFEILKIVFWFNPLMYIYQSRIAILHEFIADAKVVKTTEKRTYYEQMLNTAFNTQNISFINQFFNHSLIKKRIVMLQKSRSKAIAKFKYLTLVPLLLIMLTYVACSEDNAIQKTTYQDEENPKTEKRNASQDIKIEPANGVKISSRNETETLDPLYFMNGKEMEDDFLVNSVEPTNIESVNVLKGKAATDKYGEKGKNGVIEISTKDRDAN